VLRSILDLFTKKTILSIEYNLNVHKLNSLESGYIAQMKHILLITSDRSKYITYSHSSVLSRFSLPEGQSETPGGWTLAFEETEI
jgi:hypothetical protein